MSEDDKINKLLDQYNFPIKKALSVAVKYGQIDGDHHKAWVIDQMVRVLLTDDDYEKFLSAYADGEDGPHTYSWETGVAP